MNRLSTWNTSIIQTDWAFRNSEIGGICGCMKATALLLACSFLVPAVCEVYSALGAPSPHCSQMTPEPEPDRTALQSCCVLAALNRPALRELKNSETQPVLVSIALPPIPFYDFTPTARRDDPGERQRLSHSSPPRLWVLNASFLI